ncbi:glycoside hydrolase family 15 protein [Calditerricola yamamurae]
MSHRMSYYGAVGNGETAALISPVLSVDWLPVPRIDAFPLFARALDPMRGGALTLDAGRPLVPIRQAYVPHTNVLVTEARAGDLSLTVTDFMPWGRRLLIREGRITNTGGTEAVQPVKLAAVPTQTRARTYTVEQDDHRVAISGVDGHLVAELIGAPQRLAPGETATFRVVVAYGPTAEEAARQREAAAACSQEQEVAFWERWLRPARPLVTDNGEWREAYTRSLLVLKLLCLDNGAMIAAPTASFPAVPGGHDNWDYRYLWLRDGYLTSLTLDICGLHDEPRRFYELAFRLQDDSGEWRQPLYTIDGGNPTEWIDEDLAGPNGERPIRFGNEAAGQLQLDNAGNIVHGVWMHAELSGDWTLPARYWPNIRKAADWVTENWMRPENGIWEIRERLDHWLHGKAICYACLRAASRIAERLGHDEDARRWRTVAETIRRDVLTRGWNAERQAFLQSYAPDAPLDISVLALAFYGLLDPRDERMTKTVALIETPLKKPNIPVTQYTTASPYAHVPASEKGGLNMWGGIARYDYAAVPFYLPTLWLARYHLMVNNRSRAEELIRVCLDSATDLLLMAEHFDPRTRQQWGNFPQAFSHLEMARILLEITGGFNPYRLWA